MIKRAVEKLPTSPSEVFSGISVVQNWMVLLKEDQGKMQAVINSMLCWAKQFKPRNILLVIIIL